MKKLRIYADTSVFGGCFDEEFAKESGALFQEVRSGRFRLLVSSTTIRELDNAPKEVQAVLGSISPEVIEYLELSDEVADLRDAYITAGIVGASSLRDAEHIALASVADADLVVSWNFKHIVHYEKIAGYNAVNLLRGYRPLQIFSPREVVTP